MENDAAQQKRVQLDGKTILWIEDDVLISEIIKKKLQRYDVNLLHAFDSGEAFKYLDDGEKPEIIFLDILLPGMNGYEILERLKSEEATKNVPVIILSNFGQKSEIEKGLKLGAEKFLIKATITLDEVFREAETILSRNVNNS